MCVGVMDRDAIQRGRAAGVGNAIIYVGAKTGRDGINGASFASAEFSAAGDADCAAVQVGDPFMEKLLTDACLEVSRAHRAVLVGIQDMGAAGLVSSSVEMADKAGAGMRLDLDRVPQREPGMTPYEIMLSESQERMLLCVQAGAEQEVMDVFTQNGLDAVAIGRVTAGHQYQLVQHGQVVCDVPVSLLTDDAPIYHQVGVRPARLAKPASDFTPTVTDIRATWLALMAQPTVASKRSLYQRYDAQVKTNTMVLPGGDAGVIRVRGTHRALALTTDSNGRYLYLDPERGGAMVVAEAARNLVATGAEPLGVTDCLNYGDPTNPEHFYELAASAKGIVAATKALNTPVVSGNVSLYNETDGAAIYPTPMIGMVGLIRHLTDVTPNYFREPGEVLYLVGTTGTDFNGTELQKMLTGGVRGRLFGLDLATEQRRQQVVLAAIRQGLVTAAHDLSVGGLAAGLAEMTFTRGIGATVNYAVPNSLWFAETPSRFLVTVAPDQIAAFEQLLGEEACYLGTTTAANTLAVTTQDETIDIPVAELQIQYEEAIPCLMK